MKSEIKIVRDIRRTYRKLDKRAKKAKNLRARTSFVKASTYLKAAVTHFLNGVDITNGRL